MMDLDNNLSSKKRAQFKLNLHETIESFKNEDVYNKLLKPEAKLERLKKSKDFFSWCREYYPAFASHEFNVIHKYLINNAINASDLYPLAGPRGSAKTTIMRLYIVYAICYKKFKFGVIISHTDKLARNTILDVIEMININKKLQYDFNIEIQEKSDKRFIINHICFMIATHLISFRGLIYMNYRPDFVFVDDFENRLTVKNRDICNQKYEYILSEVMGGVDITVSYTVVWVGNLIQRGSAIDQAIKENPKTGRRFLALYKNEDDELTSYWPERFSVQMLLKEKDKLSNKPWIWYGEYQQKYYNKSSVLMVDWLQPYEELDHKKLHRTIAILDPAYSIRKKACMKAFVNGSIDSSDKQNCNYYIHDLYLRHGSYSELLNYAIKSIYKFNSQNNTLYFENNAEQWISIEPSYKALEESVRKSFKMKPFYNDQKIPKELRIESQIETMEQSRLYISKSVLDSDDGQELLTQWGRYPDGLKDGPDIITMFMIHIHKFKYSMNIYNSRTLTSKKRRGRYITSKNKVFQNLRTKHAKRA